MFLWNSLAAELAAWCSGTSTTLDSKTVERRVKHEGLSFLTITLPTFGKDFQKSLAQGAVTRDLFQGFSWQAGLPRFLGGFLESVFDRQSGVLLDEPNIDAIFAIQQLTQLFSKILLPCSDERVQKAMSGFIQCEHEIKLAHESIQESSWLDFDRVSGLLLSNLFSRVDSDVYYGRIVPKHGPGATAERVSSNGKYSSRLWTERLESVFPFMENLSPSYSLFDDFEESVDLRDPGSEIPVRVIPVPKTLKTPRIIAIEPTPMQYMQQGLLESFDSHIYEINHLRNMIGFRRQEPNQLLAMKGSLDGSYATLDLSEASDRVSNQQVRRLLRNHPYLGMAVDATRSRKADVPGFGVKRLAKFASMGSALCFPFEAMVFLTIVFMGIEAEDGHPMTKERIHALKRQVRVYGDDIIVPNRYAEPVIRYLETFGFRVNRTKSFWTGKFRESCGKEYYDGVDVSPVKFRRLFPTSLEHVSEIQSLVAFRNLLYERGLWKTAWMLDSKIRRILPLYPKVGPDSQAIGALTFLPVKGERDHPTLYKPLVMAYVASNELPIDVIDSWDALMKFHLKRGSMPLERSSFRRAGRPSVVRLKRKWVSPY